MVGVMGGLLQIHEEHQPSIKRPAFFGLTKENISILEQIINGSEERILSISSGILPIYDEVCFGMYARSSLLCLHSASCQTITSIKMHFT
jgi:hypothetical protein